MRLTAVALSREPVGGANRPADAVESDKEFLNQDTPDHPEPPQPDDSAPPAEDAPSEVRDPPAEAAPLTLREPTADETVKETIESIVIAFILAFVFRAFIVEPFIIPTGSMAPTLYGAHLQMDCESCGYGFDIGVNMDPAAGVVSEGALQKAKSADCPMCNYEVVAQIGTHVRSGDRILVDKFSYHLAEPSRWDVIVFKAPQSDPVNTEPVAPKVNFIKRLVGLPGERVALHDGNIYVAPAGTDDFVIARKTDPDTNRHWQDIQRSVWQPVYHSQYVPIEDGRATGAGRDGTHVWRVPWQVVPGQGAWDLGTARSPKRIYRFEGGDSALRFEMQGDYGTAQYDENPGKHPYNNGSGADSPIEDIRLACAFTPLSDQATLRLSTTARLDRPDNGIETLVASVSRSGAVELKAISEQGKERSLGTKAQLTEFKKGIAAQIELWLVDDEASIWVNGERVVVQRFDLTWEQIARRPKQRTLPEVRIAVKSDGPVELRRVELDRDLYYFPRSAGFGSFTQMRGQVKPKGDRLDAGSNPFELRTESAHHDAEYFVLGDNQPASDDSRAWTGVNGWIQQRYFGGDDRPGVVPRSLLVGRAFMVYYPAPHGTSPQDKGVLPDFGRMRFIH